MLDDKKEVAKEKGLELLIVVSISAVLLMWATLHLYLITSIIDGARVAHSHSTYQIIQEHKEED